MNIVILGAGSTGSYLATVLSKEDHNVIVIDIDHKALEKLSQLADVATKVGSGTDWRLLLEVKDCNPDCFIAMSSNDEINLVACDIAKQIGYPKTLSRIRQNFFLDGSNINFSRIFSVDHILGTEMIVAHELLKCILNPGNLAIENFAHGAVQMQTIIMPEDFPEKGKSLAEMKVICHLLVGLIRRKGRDDTQTLIFPKGNDILQPGDEVTIVGRTQDMHHLHKILGIVDANVRSAVIVGISGVALHLIKYLLEKKISVKVIEQDDQKCSAIARQFPSVTILNHDGTDFDFLREEQVYLSDVFVACTRSHETNVLAAILGKQAGCKEVLALVSDESIVPVLQKFHISYTFSERASITRRVQVLLHDETVISLASLYENQAKIFEVKISSQSPLIDKPICTLRGYLPKDFLIAMVKNHAGIVIPKGDTILVAGDTVIVICCPDSIAQVKELF